MKEIDTFMGREKDAVVVIRFKDHDSSARSKIQATLTQEVTQELNHVKLNDNPNPRLNDAINSNKRLFVFANGGFNPKSPIHELKQVLRLPKHVHCTQYNKIQGQVSTP